MFREGCGGTLYPVVNSSLVDVGSGEVELNATGLPPTQLVLVLSRLGGTEKKGWEVFGVAACPIFSRRFHNDPAERPRARKSRARYAFLAESIPLFPYWPFVVLFSLFPTA